MFFGFNLGAFAFPMFGGYSVGYGIPYNSSDDGYSGGYSYSSFSFGRGFGFHYGSYARPVIAARHHYPNINDWILDEYLGDSLGWAYMPYGFGNSTNFYFYA